MYEELGTLFCVSFWEDRMGGSWSLTTLFLSCYCYSSYVFKFWLIVPNGLSCYFNYLFTRPNTDVSNETWGAYSQY